ncbi:F-box protein PP2-B11-like [Euphorbia lathyris]|uniref:F-box protein PP2-B11-like n=1 Tax=Euphorbia lathyris TaxID=212925 RepID=UPI003313A032
MTGVDLCQLQEDCIATVFSFTSPKDTGQCSIVSSGFKSVSESDAVWRHFLPFDYRALISQSSLASLIILVTTILATNVWQHKPCSAIQSNKLPNTPFAEVTELIVVCWLEIRGKIKATMLSPKTHYTAYLVYKTAVTTYGFDNPVEVNVGISGAEEGDS